MYWVYANIFENHSLVLNETKIECRVQDLISNQRARSSVQTFGRTITSCLAGRCRNTRSCEGERSANTTLTIQLTHEHIQYNKLKRTLEHHSKFSQRSNSPSIKRDAEGHFMLVVCPMWVVFTCRSVVYGHTLKRQPVPH